MPKLYSITPVRLLLVNIVVFIIFSILAFYQNNLYLFYGLDGHYMLTLAKENVIWRDIEFGLSNNYFQSLGDIEFPMNTMLIPGYITLSLINVSIFVKKILAYTVFSLEFFFLGLLISRILSLNWTQSLLSAWLLPLLTYPYYSNPPLYAIMVLVPHLGTIIFTANLMVILFLYIGKQNFGKSVIYSTFITILAIYISLAAPASLIICAPEIIIISILYLGSCKSNIEKKHKLIFSVAILLFLILSKVFLYHYGLLKFTAAYYFSDVMLNTRMDWSYVSILFHKYIGTMIFIGGLLGAVSALLDKNIHNRAIHNRSIARGVLATMLFVLLFGGLTIYSNFWNGPSPLYFEFFLWPFYISYSVACLCKLISYLWPLILNKKHGLNNFLIFFYQKLESYLNYIPKQKIITASYFNSAAVKSAMILSIAILFGSSIFLLHPPKPQDMTPYPPHLTPIVDILSHRIALKPGDPFKGRAANFTGLSLKNSINWFDLFTQDFIIQSKLGNEHRMNGFWFYNIPTLDVYTPLISPVYFQFSTLFFSLPQDQQMRNVMTLRKPNIRWLKALGVKYLVTDAPIPNSRKLAALFILKHDMLYLYELLSPNLGQYSPTHVIPWSNAQEVLKILEDKTFNPSDQIVLKSNQFKKLTQASNIQFLVEKGALRIHASSTGHSLILLPLEFSHCLTLTSYDRHEKPQMYRANYIQTAIFFHHHLDVSISYFTGPFYHSACRLEDAKDFENELSLRGVPYIGISKKPDHRIK
jgi:hypothetical protein